MIGRIIWWTLLVAVAGLTTALQLDKQADVTPSLAPLVPAPLRNYAQAQIAAQTAAAEDPARALAEAQALVIRRPLPAEYLSLLAVAQAKDGQAEQSGLTIQIAGQRGWREPVAQEAVLRLALNAGDKAEAARRYAALFLRAETPDTLLLELGPQVFDTPGGPGETTLIDIVAGGERWHNQFMRRGALVMPPAAFSAVTRAAAERGVEFDCALLEQAMKTLERRDPAAAQSLAAAKACG
ncbi:MAG TPA: hypothetical protein VLA50_01620 [Erythrobacter sp.]|nr:hypothetical protein [Erythrobacter sp.]